MAIVPGVYLHEKDENFEEFLQQNGVNYLLRKMISKSRPTATVAKGEQDGEYTISMKTSFKQMDIHFILDQPVMIQDPLTGGDGKKSIFTIEGNKLIQSALPDDPSPKNKVIREFTETGMVMTLINIPSGKEAKRYFKKQ